MHPMCLAQGGASEGVQTRRSRRGGSPADPVVCSACIRRLFHFVCLVSGVCSDLFPLCAEVVDGCRSRRGAETICGADRSARAERVLIECWIVVPQVALVIAETQRVPNSVVSRQLRAAACICTSARPRRGSAAASTQTPTGFMRRSTEERGRTTFELVRAVHGVSRSFPPALRVCARCSAPTVPSLFNAEKRRKPGRDDRGSKALLSAR